MQEIKKLRHKWLSIQSFMNRKLKSKNFVVSQVFNENKNLKRIPNNLNFPPTVGVILNELQVCLLHKVAGKSVICALHK